MDIGTNAEVALVASGGISACSCAAGPAFEGRGISQGMRAMEGAISRVEVARKQIDIDVIGGGEARGITGSGMISLAGERYEGCACYDYQSPRLVQIVRVGAT